MLRAWTLTLFVGLCAGCISKGKDGSTNIDLRGCQAVPRVPDAPPLHDGPVTLATGAKEQPVASALAWGTVGQHTLNLELSTSAPHCSDLEVTDLGRVKGGVLASIRIAPVLIDRVLDQKGNGWSVVPAAGTWRAVSVFVSAPYGSRESGFWDITRSEVETPPHAVAEKGAHTKLRFVIEGKGSLVLGGALDVEGCGLFPTSLIPRPQPNIDVRVGDRRVPILGATYRPLSGPGAYELRLTSAASDCDKEGRSDVVVGIRPDVAYFLGEALPTAYNYGSIGIVVSSADGGASGVDGGARETRSFDVSGPFLKPSVHSTDFPPRGDLEPRRYEEHTAIAGRVDALLCPAKP